MKLRVCPPLCTILLREWFLIFLYRTLRYICEATPLIPTTATRLTPTTNPHLAHRRLQRRHHHPMGHQRHLPAAVRRHHRRRLAQGRRVLTQQLL